MKRFALMLVATVMVLALVSCNQDKGPQYNVGDTGPAGGIIFAVVGDADSITYYEAAPKSAEKTEVFFGNFYDSENGFICDLIRDSIESTQDISSVGTGRSNTAAIMSVASVADIKIYSDQFPNDEYLITEFAAKVAADCNAGGKTDWYLPSVEELRLMYTQLKAKGLGGFSDDCYWSSSQHGMQAGSILFADGSDQGGKDYDYKYSVRPIRSFN